MRDYVDVLERVEGYYPKARGTVAGNDEILRRNLVPYANLIADEVVKRRRYKFAQTSRTLVTTSGVSLYSVAPTPNALTPFEVWPTLIYRVYFLQESGGRPRIINAIDEDEGRRRYGDGADATLGIPRYFSFIGQSLKFWPAPDDNGPTAGNYSIVVSGYAQLNPIVETEGTTPGASLVVTVPATDYIVTRLGLAVGGSSLVGVQCSLREAGLPQFAAAPARLDPYVSTIAVVAPTTVTLTSIGINPATVTAQQFFVNSQNWLIAQWPKILIAGMCREVCLYLRSFDEARTWESRYQQELEGLDDYDADSRRDKDVMATAQYGQDAAQLTDIDTAWGWGPR